MSPFLVGDYLIIFILFFSFDSLSLTKTLRDPEVSYMA